MNTTKDIIFLSGGGTLGSVTPLLAIAEDLGTDYACHFVGTDRGVEREVASDKGLVYHAIASGKLRRYWSLRNFIDPFFIVYGILESLFLISKHQPKLIVSAGSFASVSLAIAARLSRVPIIILQLDVIPGLANRIMAKIATKIAVTIPESKKDYPEAQVTGCPIRAEIKSALHLSKAAAKHSFNFDPHIPTILILGGGTGSVAINKLVLDNLYNLTQICQVIHVTGKAKHASVEHNARYYSAELISHEQMAAAYAASELVISRAGMGVITELSYLSKASVLIPMAHSHQEANADYFAKLGATIKLDQSKITAWNFVSEIKTILSNSEQQRILAAKLNKALPQEGNKKFLELVKSCLNK